MSEADDGRSSTFTCRVVARTASTPSARRSLANARASVQEPGVARFDVIQQEDDPTRFELIEIYRTPDAAAAHKATAHYAAWRDAVAPLMAEPRSSTKYRAVFPETL